MMSLAGSKDKIWELRGSFVEADEDDVSVVEVCVDDVATPTGPPASAPGSSGCSASASAEQERLVHSEPNSPGDSPNDWNSKAGGATSASHPQEWADQHSTSMNGSISSLLSDRSGSVISFHNISYHVKVKTKRLSCGRAQKKYILRDVSGVCRPGMNAILGPTGSGKTSLLDLLAARKDPRGLRGQVLLDGTRQPSNFKCMSGYVIQDDIVMGMLTVRENIQFSASLRLHRSMSHEKRNQRVEEVIMELGLAKCADTRVGTEFMRGISGGERKRTSIGMELITSPSVLFLDEPTTGLDSNTAYSVMHLLKKLSHKGRTVVFSIHQPRYSIFKLFENLILLSQGECVFHGPAREALGYFESAGYYCEPHNNPSDFFLDVLNGAITPVAISQTERIPTPNGNQATVENQENHQVTLDVDDGENTAEIQQRSMVECFRQSKWNAKLEAELSLLQEIYHQSEKRSTATRKSVQYPTSTSYQLGVVSCRTFRILIRNPHTLMTQVMSAVILGLIVGTIYFQIDLSRTSGIQNRVGAFFFIVMNYVFGNMAAVDIFLKERALFIHENVSGFYRVSVYFLAKLFLDVVPQRAIPIIVFSGITYWMIGLQAHVWNFLFYMLNIFLTSLAGTSVALVFSATTSVHTIGTIFTALVWVFMMVFSGLLVNVDTVTVWLRWMKWLSIFRYSMNAFMVNELKDVKFCDTVSPTVENMTGVEELCDYGNEHLEKQGIPYESSLDLWLNELALLGLALGFLLLTYIQLRRMKKLK